MKRMLFLLLAVLMLLLAPAMQLHAQAAESNVTWDLTDGVLTISGSGTMEDYNGAVRAPWYSRQTSIESVVVEEGVTSIGTYAFYSCTSLSNITIPDSVTSIGSSAFSGCTSLSSITIPDSVTSIGGAAFGGCTSLSSITIPDSVTSMGSSVFRGCSSLESLTIPFVGGSVKTETDSYQYPFGYIFGTSSYTGGVGTIQRYYGEDRALDSEYYYIPSSLKTVTVTGGNILYGAFHNCGNLTTVTLPEGITNIGDDAFFNCTSLSSITIPDGITSIGDSAFAICKSLTSVTIPVGVISIGTDVFRSCTNLSSITIPVGVTSIGEEAFQYCESLSSIMIPDGVTDIGDYTFQGCTSLSSITIPDSVTGIGDYAFQGCKSLSSITIPDSVTGIGDYAFQGCTSLSSITIPDSVTSIGGGAFSRCSGLESMTIPFVGGREKGSLESFQYPFGYIFGTSSYTGGVATTQYYYGSSISSTTYSTYYIPSTLKSVTVTGGKILYGAFYNCGNLTTVTLSKGIYRIGQSAFDNCKSLTSIALPESVKNIDQRAFYGCKSLTGVTIPASVTSIGSNAFYNCTSLSRVDITDIAAWCKIEFGSEYSNPLCYGGSGWYLNGEQITNIMIPEGITAINNYAFYNGTSLTGVAIPDSVTSIGQSAFHNCSGLELIHYCGTSTQKEEITIGSDNTSLTDAAWHYDCQSAVFGEKRCIYCPICDQYFLPNGSYPTATVVFKNWDGSVISSATYHYGDEVAIPPDPARETDDTASYTFSGWDKEVVPCAGDAIYTATYKATEKTSAEDKDPTTPPTEATKPEETKPTKPTTPPAEETKPTTPPAEDDEPTTPPAEDNKPMENPFGDVAEDAYYSDPVKWAVENGITNGLDETHFGPEMGCTRAHVVTFLWRAAGSPGHSSHYNPFVDVLPNSYYYNAVLWAVEKGITNGTSATTFDPDATCTRGQIVTFLWRYKDSPVVEFDDSFSDVPADQYYSTAVAWAVANGITNGMGEGLFAPDATCTRGQIVTFLYRAMAE